MPKDTALVIIDVQLGLVSYEDQKIYRMDEVLQNIKALQQQARERGVPVIFVQHDGPEGDSLHPLADGWAIHPEIAPRPGELVIRKRDSDAFHNTHLQEELDKRGIHNLIVMGGQTEFCVTATVNRAIMLGYNVTVVKDGHFTWDRVILSAARIVDFYNDVWADSGSASGCSITVQPAKEVVI